MTPRFRLLLLSMLALGLPAVRASAATASDAGNAAATAAPSPELKATETIDLGDGVTMEFVLIRPGAFTMGTNNHEYDEMPAHRVNITAPFYLGRFEVTQAQWEKVMHANPSHFQDPQRPVENVSWEDCQRFVAALRDKLGRGFALPTEAQWEYACRAGTTTEFSFGADETALADHAWFSGNAEQTTHPVGRKLPNRWGLFDMHGNVFEWCADTYSDKYPAGEVSDPFVRGAGSRRILRGGAWLYVPDNLRSSDRGFSPPDSRSDEYGFRCVMLVAGTPDLTATPAPSPETAAPVSRDPAQRAAAMIAQAREALSDANKLYAELLLAEAGRLAPGHPDLAALRHQAEGMPAPADTLVVDLGSGITMEFVLIKPGTFLMGSADATLENEKPAHTVTITKPFYLGKYEVTQEQWQALMSRNLSAFKTSPDAAGSAKLPVENVSWYLCHSFLAKLNQRDCGHEFRLPTEAEWEYACRAGSTGPYSFGDPAHLAEHAWSGENAEGRTHQVGTRKPNAWGLYDMYGNVWEWCADWLGKYPAADVRDPAGPADWGMNGGRVLRGGAWNNSRAHVNSSFRHEEIPDVLMRYYGFRCAATISAPTGK